ncbi:MAG: protein kinase [Gemmatimonadales bacterium]|nr:protein kinase [Gemmatimonadales bacterium]
MNATPQRCRVCAAELPPRGKYCPECGTARPDATEGDAQAGSDATSSAAELHRQRLQRALGDQYELGRLIGRGGFAEVYLAHDRRLKRDVAVKTLRYDLHASTILLERFQREAEAMAQLRHPHVMPIYSVGEGEGLAYFVMPFVKGETLGQRIRQAAPLPIDFVRRVLHEVAGALHHAHSAGVVHRDVKPDNILLEGDEARVLVTDFGIARAAEETGGALTGTGIILGTPDYMSPEQASEEKEVDHRSDLYSLGVVAYQMLTGELPYRASTLQGLIVKLITEEAPPVTRRRPDCPADLAAIVGRCLAKEPEDRFASAAELNVLLRPQSPTEAAAPRLTGVRAAIRGAAAVPATPVARFRRSVVLFLLGIVSLLALDLLMNGAVDFAPAVAALWCIPVASQYGRLWTTGYTWRDILRGGDGPPSGSVSSETGTRGARSGAFGSHADAVHHTRSERAVIAGLIANMPRAEREKIPGMVGSADRIVARTRAVARQLHRLERVLEEGATLGAAGAYTSQQRRDEIEIRREAMTGELQVLSAVIEEMRTAVERADAMGVAESRTDLDVAFSKANDVARSR